MDTTLTIAAALAAFAGVALDVWGRISDARRRAACRAHLEAVLTLRGL